MSFPHPAHQVAHQQRLFIGDLAVRLDDEPCDPQQQPWVLASSTEVVGELEHPSFVPEHGPRMPSCEHRRVPVHDDRERYTDERNPDLDYVALEEVLPDDGEPPCCSQDWS